MYRTGHTERSFALNEIQPRITLHTGPTERLLAP